MVKQVLAAAVVASLWLGVGCGGDDGGGNNNNMVNNNNGNNVDVDAGDAFTCTEPGTVCVTLNVPSDFSGTPMRLSASGYTNAPPPTGPPDVLLWASNNSFDIGVGQPYEWKINLAPNTITGTYYPAFTLYVSASAIPLSGIDYLVVMPTSYTFASDSGAALNLGEVELALFP